MIDKVLLVRLYLLIRSLCVLSLIFLAEMVDNLIVNIKIQGIKKFEDDRTTNTTVRAKKRINDVITS